MKNPFFLTTTSFVAIFLVLIGACSKSPSMESSQGVRVGLEDENAAQELNQIASSNMHRDANGNVTSVDGLKLSSNLTQPTQESQNEKPEEQVETEHHQLLKNSIINDDKLFEYQEPDSTDADFSEPKMVSASFLALTNTLSTSCDGSGTFSDSEPRISTVINHQKECGTFRIYFCIRLSPKDATNSAQQQSTYAFLETPELTVNIPCKGSIFKGLSLSINDNSDKTASTTADLTVTARPLVSQMYVTNSSDCSSGGDWEPISSKKRSWSLSFDNDMTKASVYAKFKDLIFGYESDCIEASISFPKANDSEQDLLINNTETSLTNNTQNTDSNIAAADTTPPIATSLSLASGAMYTTSSTLNLDLAATDASEMYVTNTPGCASGGSWESYAVSKSGWILGETNTTTAVYVKYRDEAGNESACINDSIIHDNTAPTFTTLSISSGATYTTSTSVSLGLSASDTNSLEMYITNTSGCASGGEWESYAVGKAWTLGQTNSTATVYGKVRDAAGNESDCINGTIIHDNVSPTTPASLSKNSASTTQASFTWTDSTDTGGSGIGDYELAIGTTSGGSETKDWTSVGTVLTSTLTGLTLSLSTTYYPSVRATDAAGNTGDVKTGSGFVPISPPIAIASPSGGNCALFEHGTVKCWGYNWYGQLGQNHTSVLGDDAGEMASLSPIGFKGGALMSQLSNTAQNLKHMCAISTVGNLYCWGLNFNGQLGQGNTTDVGATSNSMSNLNPVNLGTGRTAVQVAVGGSSTCAILDNGTAKCWGGNTKGQLGQGNTTQLTSPPASAINLGSGRTATKIRIGLYFACALLDNATLKCWGQNTNAQLGLGYKDANNVTTPNLAIDFGGSLSVTDFSIDTDYGCAVLSNGTVKCWGYQGLNKGSLGQNISAADYIGDSANEIANLAAVNLGAGNSATQIEVCGEISCALLAGNDAGKVKCWGAGASGRLGQENTANYGTDTVGYGMENLNPINLGTSRTAVKISVGGSSSCALLDNNTVKCWGHAGNGQLGHNAPSVTNHRGDEPGEMGDSLPVVDFY